MIMMRLETDIHRTSRRPRPRNVVLIGHLSNKSSVYSPTSMSRMSQDLVHNHMKSHYQRIASAKASVDTSAPKSMKLIIKEKDRKRQESFQRSFQTTAVRRSSSSQKHSERKNMDTSNIQSETSCSPRTFEVMGETKREHIENNMLMDGMRENRTNKIGGQSNGVNQYNSKNSRKYVFEQSLRIDSSSLSTPFDHDHVYNTSTPRPQTEDELQDDAIASSPSLQMSNISFSYKTPPSPRRKSKKIRSEEIIWTEEQKYLHFISEVTTDVLDRGVFSNRVLNRVFESHIEKRKDDLDEEHMREMIDQLKQDLDITDC